MTEQQLTSCFFSSDIVAGEVDIPDLEILDTVR